MARKKKKKVRKGNTKAKKVKRWVEGEDFEILESGSKRPTLKRWQEHFNKKHPGVELELVTTEGEERGRIYIKERRPPAGKRRLGGVDKPADK